VSTKAFHGGASFSAIGVDLKSLENRENIIDADVLDAWYPPAPNIVEAIQTHLEWLIKTSPPTHGEGLRDAIAKHRGIASENILIGAGSSALMFLLFPQLLTKQSKVTILDPMYGEYAHLVENVVGAELKRCVLPESTGFTPQLGEIVAKSEGADMLIMVNPNSPTGVGVSSEFFEKLLLEVKPATKIWVDETYIDFMPGKQSVESFVSRFPNLIVSKSMSKYYGLSGLRLGYVVGAKEIVEKAERFSPPWGVGLMAQLAGIEALDATDYYQKRSEETRVLREQMSEGLKAIPGITVYESVTNYLLFSTESSEAELIVSSAKLKGVYLRNCDSLSSRFNGRFVRTVVKDGGANDKIVSAIRSALAK